MNDDPDRFSVTVAANIRDFHIFNCFTCDHRVWRFKHHHRVTCFKCIRKIDAKEADTQIALHDAEYARYHHAGLVKEYNDSVDRGSRILHEGKS